MQFHLNGLRPGDPAVADAVRPAGRGDEPDRVDVLIIGCGPAGLTLAAQLAAFPDITTRIIDVKPGPLELGQADGIACRTMEMFEAFGFSERVAKESYWVNETVFWKPDDTRREHIVRQGRIRDTEEGLSEFPHVILNQARVHDFFLEAMRAGPARLEPAYARRLLDVTAAPEERDADAAPNPDAYPLTARIECGDGSIETVAARFVVGCDGARSRVRTAIGRTLAGDSANRVWGVMDVLAVTDFPDIRLKATVHSASEGSILMIPREGGYLVRLYIELDKLAPHERVADRDITVERLIAAAQRILRPYTLDVKEVAWWSAYEIGQRLCDRFDDLADDARDDAFPRIFIAGDACHTHSPKAGQGMNVSMQDSFNLGWKLAAVLRGQSSPRLLRSYSRERQAIARELIEFDRSFAAMFSAAPKDPSDPASTGIDPAEFQKYFVRQGRFTAGTATRYGPSRTVGPSKHQELAGGFTIGMRFHSAPVVRLADARPLHLGHAIKADGRWRLLAFAGTQDPAAIHRLCAFLSDDARSPIRLHTPTGADPDAVIDVRAVFQQPHHDLSADALPAALLPRKGRYGLIDYEKAFCADPAADIFDLRRIDRARGCVIIVRPDQYVAHILPLDAHAELARFFAGILWPARSERALLDDLQPIA